MRVEFHDQTGFVSHLARVVVDTEPSLNMRRYTRQLGHAHSDYWQLDPVLIIVTAPLEVMW